MRCDDRVAYYTRQDAQDLSWPMRSRCIRARAVSFEAVNGVPLYHNQGAVLPQSVVSAVTRAKSLLILVGSRNGGGNGGK